MRKLNRSILNDDDEEDNNNNIAVEETISTSAERKTPEPQQSNQHSTNTPIKSTSKRKKKTFMGMFSPSKNKDEKKEIDVELGQINPSILYQAGDRGQEDMAFTESLGQLSERMNHRFSIIKKASVRIRDCSVRFKAAENDQAEQSIEEKKEFAIKKAKLAMIESKDELDHLKVKFEKEDEGNQKKSYDPKSKMERNMARLLTKKYQDTAQEYREALIVYDDTVKSKLARKIRVFDPDMTEERVQEIIATGQTESYLQQLVIYGQQSNELKEAFSKAQQQRSALLELEDSINQVQAMFHEFSLMVQDQGQLIDNIEANVEDAVDNVQQGNVMMVGAIQKKRKRRRICMICSAIIVVLVVVLIIILITQLT